MNNPLDSPRVEVESGQDWTGNSDSPSLGLDSATQTTQSFASSTLYYEAIVLHKKKFHLLYSKFNYWEKYYILNLISGENVIN